MNFNSEIFVNEKALISIKDVAIEFAHSCVMECSRRYKFDGDEAVRLLGLRNPTVKTKMKKEKRVVDKPKFIFPYSGGRNEDTCQGLILNGGLFTQCEMSKKTQLYCGKCSKQAEQNSHGTPNYGTIMDRNSVGIMDYIDPTGKGPLSYLKFIKKKKWDLEQVQEEARKYSIEINEIHFVEENSTKKRGRKPRVRSQVAYDTDDEPSEEGIFDTIIDKTTNGLAEDNSTENVSLEDDDEISSQFLKLGVNEVAQQETEPVLQITEPPVEPTAEQEMPVDVMVLEEEIPTTVIEEPVEADSKLVKVKKTDKLDKTEKQKQKEIDKQAKLLEKEMEKKRRDDEANAKKVLAAAAKNSKPSNSKQSSKSMDNKPKADVFCKKGKEPCIVVSQPQVTPQTPQTPPTPKKKAAEPSVSVKPFTHDGVRYYKSTDNILYDKAGNPQGLWDETTKTIIPITEDDVEEEEEAEEEESDQDDNSEEEEEEYEEEEEEQKGSARHASKPNSDLLDEIEYYECLRSN
jgi:hypothetical protein